jgi:hypothetical protein
LCPLSVDPFPDVCRTVSECDALVFTEQQEFHRRAVDHADLLEIDGNGLAFLIDRGTKDIHIVSSNPPAYAQEHDVAINQTSVDSAGHSGLTPLGSLYLQTERQS